MPRKRTWLEIVEEFPPLQPDHWYRVRIAAVEKDRAHNALVVTLEHLDTDQAGRSQTCSLPLPLRPTNVAGAMLSSAVAAQPLAVGQAVAPREAVGSLLETRFGPTPDGRDWQPVAFRPVAKE